MSGATPLDLSDADLARSVSTALSSPRTVDNSFTLHAPLELMARLALLPLVHPDHRDRARGRLASLATIYQGTGDPIPLPDGPSFASRDEAFAAFLAAVRQGDADTADRAWVHLVEAFEVAELCARLAPATTTMMTAAGHAPILLANWPACRERLDGRMGRNFARRMCEHSGIAARVPHPNDSRGPGSLEDLDAALRGVEILGDPGWGIFMTVHQAEAAGLTARLPAVAADRIDDAFAVACRVAAASMLLDDPRHAAYQWSHALSLPMGLWGAHRHHADPAEALDVALTHVLAFRSGYGTGPIGDYAPAPPGLALAEALDAGPTLAGAAAFHDPAAESELIATLATAASIEHDAHVAKYVHACIDAVGLDPGASRTYLAAAAHLTAWWRENPAADDPLR